MNYGIIIKIIINLEDKILLDLDWFTKILCIFYYAKQKLTFNG